jgi:ketosteroid isomerase-like protein
VLEEFQAAMERRDPGAVFDSEAATDDFESIVPDPGFEGTSVWRGREGFVEFVRTWTEEFEDWSIRDERFIDVGDDRVVVLTHQSATGKASGGAGRVEERQVWELKDGRVVRGEELSITPTPSKPPGCRGNHAIRPV